MTRSYTVKKERRNQRKLDIDSNFAIKEENESSKENISDSQEDIINEEDSEFHPVSKFQYYFELFMTIIMFFHIYLIYSYLNIIHLIYCFLLTYSRYEINYNFILKNKKTLMIVLIIIDSIYLVLKSILIYISISYFICCFFQSR